MPWSSLIGAFFKPIAGFAFGTPKATKITMILIGVVLFGGTVWYMTNASAKKDLKIAEQAAANELFDREFKQLAHHNKQLEKQIAADKLALENQLAAIDALNKQFKITSEQYENDRKVFDKEKGRFNRLLQVDGDRIVKLANYGTERMRKRYEKATNDADRIPPD